MSHHEFRPRTASHASDRTGGAGRSSIQHALDTHTGQDERGETASYAALLEELTLLRDRVELLEQERADWKIMHDTIVQHADEIETELQQRYRQLEERNCEIIRLNHQLETAQQELEQLVRIDPLTQLANRRFLDAVLEREWLLLGRNKKPLSLLLTDIDFFKLYNDHYGHQAGDRCLIAVAQVLQAAVHRSDDVVARYGGEEMAIVLPNTNKQGARAVAQNLLNLLAKRSIPHHASPIAKCVTISVGVATMIPDLQHSVDQLLYQADTALYQTKTRSRNGFQVYQAEPTADIDPTSTECLQA